MRDGSATENMSRIIEQCYDVGIEGLVADTQSHEVWESATDEMVFNYMMSVFSAIARGG